ncbi:MAG TPA: siderophore ABC transporter substrate-binding protein [Albidovulum sp.]|uniref:siderophore ABC transporter substrate-binding protein n=1 Tax=Albidovulum sp. TaxID=1872424 RepID=UPI002CAFD5A5|nr:siderophore ABC transporter substrate-binding protein [Albidovulum sp.]
MKFASIAGALLIAATPALADPVEIGTARGPVSVAQTPAKVAVYDIAAIDTLLALGVTPAGVPDELYVPAIKTAAGGAAKIGTLFEPDIEALSGLDPDLVIVGGRTATQFDQVSEVAPAIDMTISPDVVGDARARLLTYGALFNKADKAAELAGTLDARIAGVQAAAKDKGNALIVMTNGPKVSAYGRGSRFGWLHDTVGLPEAYPNLIPETHGDAISFEFITEVNPDWLLVIDRGAAVGEEGASAAETLDNPLVAGTKAAQAGQVVYLDAGRLYISGGGYSSLMGTLDEMLAALKG